MVETTPEEFKHFQKIKLLGEGGFGAAFLVKNKKNEKLVMKVINFEKFSAADKASA